MKTKKRKSMIFTAKSGKFDYKILTDSRYADIVNEQIKGKHGIYILYNKEDDIYYIGKASAIMRRIEQHRTDRHSKKWERFSVFFTKKADHLDQLEDAFISIVHPKGNNQNRRIIPETTDQMEKAMKERDDELRGKMFSSDKSKQKSRKRLSKKNGKQHPCLKNYFKSNKQLIARYKGKTYTATLLTSGKIKYKNTIYKKPSPVAKEITQREMNGWDFWSIQDRANKKIKLSELGLRGEKQRITHTVTKNSKNSKPNLKNYFKNNKQLIAKYKGKTYKATLLISGKIKYKGKIYKTPSGSAQQITQPARVNGWIFWSIQDKANKKIKLSELGFRRKKYRTTSIYKNSKNNPDLKNYFTKNKSLRKTYKGKTYKATLLKSGKIKYKGKIYKTPSGSAKEIVQKVAPTTKVNGWTFWFIQDKANKWVKLSELD